MLHWSLLIHCILGQTSLILHFFFLDLILELLLALLQSRLTTLHIYNLYWTAKTTAVSWMELSKLQRHLAFTSGVDSAVLLFLFAGHLLDMVIAFSKYYLYLDVDPSATMMARETYYYYRGSGFMSSLSWSREYKIGWFWSYCCVISSMIYIAYTSLLLSFLTSRWC